jgi:Ca-activated chloride channel family protein
MRFTASVAGFGMLLRGSKYKGIITYDQILSWTGQALSYDPYQRRAEFKEVLKKAMSM